MKYVFYLDSKFWTATVDVVAYLLLFFVGKYGTPSLLEDVKTVWFAAQPVVLIVLAGLFQSDFEALREGLDVRHLVEK